MRPYGLHSLVAACISFIFSAQSHAQPIFGHAQSLDVTVANADRVIIGKLMEFDDQLPADEAGRRLATLAVEETLKGQHQERLQIWFSDHVSVLAEWNKHSSQLLVAAQDGPPIAPTVIELSSAKLEVFTADFLLLRKPDDVIRNAKELIRRQPGVTRINTFSLRLLPSAVAGTKWALNHGSSLSVPVDERLESWAQQHVQSKDDQERQRAAQALRYFKSIKNMLRVHPLLNDSGFGRLVTPDFSKGLEVRVYGVREAAYDTLTYCGASVEQPIVREARHDPALVRPVGADTQVTEEDLRELARVENLQSLILRNADVTDAKLSAVARIKELQNLDLGGTKITDAGLKHLAALKSLRYLDVGGTKITDAGLQELAGFRSLRKLDIDRTQATPAGLAELRRLRPDLEIAP